MAATHPIAVSRRRRKNSQFFKGIPRSQVPVAYRSWLFDTGSLTQRLVKLSRGDFFVQVLNQYHGSAPLQDMRLLDLPARSLPFIREVALVCSGTPWVFARTIIPRATECGPGRYLTRLGNKPLGAALFSDRQVRRGPMWIRHQRIKPELTEETVWGRQSLFYINNSPLLVSEYFLPECPMYNSP